MEILLEKAKELQVLLEAVHVASWLAEPKKEILKDYKHFVENLENLKMCDSDFKPIDGNPNHLRRESRA